MIRKFLVCGKQLYLQSKYLESYLEQGPVIELILPIQKFWDVESAVNHTNYLIASGESPVEILSAFKKIYHICAPFAVSEKDRAWLYEKAKE